MERIFIVGSLLLLGNCIIWTSADMRRYDEIMQTYNQFERPNEGGAAVEVEVTFHVNFVEMLRPGVLSMDMYVRQSWVDPRLNMTGVIELPAPYMDTIWKPDTFFYNIVWGKLEDIPIDNKLIRITPGGEVWYVYRLGANFFCESKSFINSHMSCPLKFSSFSQLSNNLKYFVGGRLQPINSLKDVVLKGENFYVDDAAVEIEEVKYTAGIHQTGIIHITLIENEQKNVASADGVSEVVKPTLEPKENKRNARGLEDRMPVLGMPDNQALNRQQRLPCRVVYVNGVASNDCPPEKTATNYKRSRLGTFFLKMKN